ncbi:MAG: tetratricopeptide repeat protein [Chloroflexi bacterium]|nr:tetratricopeptide repeat protein [Chloroflexota bacterium]
MARLNNEVGFYLNQYGQLREMKPYIERALILYERALGPDHPNTAASLNNIGFSSIRWGS